MRPLHSKFVRECTSTQCFEKKKKALENTWGREAHTSDDLGQKRMSPSSCPLPHHVPALDTHPWSKSGEVNLPDILPPPWAAKHLLLTIYFLHQSETDSGNFYLHSLHIHILRLPTRTGKKLDICCRWYSTSKLSEDPLCKVVQTWTSWIRCESWEWY